MRTANKAGQKVIPGAGLAMVLLRWARGWWDQATLAVRAGFHPSQVSMWERGERDTPEAALETTADVTGFPRHLLDPALRLLRSFRLAARGKSRPERTLAQVSLGELFPLLDQAIDLILEPLAAKRRPKRPVRSVAADRELAESLLERLKQRTERQRRLIVESVPEFQERALAELLVEESLRLAPDHPAESKEWANLAALVAERMDGSR
jgi:transcriptional regulator with XRE-family HTH domain